VSDFDEQIHALSARMTARDIRAVVRKRYDADVSAAPIAEITTGLDVEMAT
jgi:transposase-like protein